LLVGASPASAHTNSIVQGSDYAVMNNSHTSGYVCDNERDGHYTYARIYYLPDDGFAGGPINWRDSDGAGGNCEPIYHVSVYGKPYMWHMCESVSGVDPCTSPEYI